MYCWMYHGYCCTLQDSCACPAGTLWCRPIISGFPAIEDTAKRMVKAANALQIPVIVTEQYPKALGKTVEGIKEVLPEDVFIQEKLEFSMFGMSHRQEERHGLWKIWPRRHMGDISDFPHLDNVCVHRVRGVQSFVTLLYPLIIWWTWGTDLAKEFLPAPDPICGAFLCARFPAHMIKKVKGGGKANMKFLSDGSFEQLTALVSCSWACKAAPRGTLRQKEGSRIFDCLRCWGLSICFMKPVLLLAEFLSIAL